MQKRPKPSKNAACPNSPPPQHVPPPQPNIIPLPPYLCWTWCPSCRRRDAGQEVQRKYFAWRWGGWVYFRLDWWFVDERVLYCQVGVCNSKSVAEWTQVGGNTMAQTHCWLDADRGASEREGRSITFCLVYKLLQRQKMKLGASLCFHLIHNRIEEPSWDRI